jgi:hypothetical protein
MFEFINHLATVGTGKGPVPLKAGRSERKIQLGRCKRRCEDNIKVDVKEIWWDSVDCIDLAQDRDR